MGHASICHHEAASRVTAPARRRRRTAWAVLLAMGAALAGGPPAIATEADPIRVLVFSKPFGFSHTASINAGVAWMQAQGGTGLQVVNTTDPALLSKASLETFDVLMWNNSTGEAPLDAQGRRDLLDWVRDGHGFVGVHSAADSNYTWPQFADLQGGLFFQHLYDFGGIHYEPTAMRVIGEDPSSPLMAGVPADYAVMDEIYRFHADPRTDVHVLQSMDNTSIGAGAFYPWHSPLTWCRPFGAGRVWYTNFGHSGRAWSDPVFAGMVRKGLEYAGGRLPADCSVPADPYTGVKAADRMLATWADAFSGATPTVSTYSGGLSALTDLAPGSSVTWRSVDLTGVTNIDLFATAQRIAPVASGQLPQQRVTRAAGGLVQLRLDSATGPVIGTVSIPPLHGPVDHVNTPEQAGALAPVLAETSWRKLTPTNFVPVEGKHDLVLTFPGDGGAPGATGVGSLAWIHLVE